LPDMLANVVNGNDVGMLEASRCFRLRLEPTNGLRRDQFSGMNEFDGDDAVEADLAGLIHDPHAAAGDFFNQLILADRMELNDEGWGGFEQDRRKISVGIKGRAGFV